MTRKPKGTGLWEEKSNRVPGKTILVVEDDPETRDIFPPFFEREGYHCIFASNGKQGLESVRDHKPDLVVLDLNLPEVDGFEVLRQIRGGPYLPVIIVTARRDDTDKIVGLELGADDYLIKPFNPRELVARVRAAFRRMEMISRTPARVEKISAGGAELDLHTQKLRVGDSVFVLTATEFAILKLLMQNSGRVYSREEILNHVWGEEFAGEPRAVDLHVRRIRKKLDACTARELIHAVRGVGYKFEP